MKILGFLCSPSIYEYKGRLFEFGHMTGPWPIRKKDGEPYERAGKRFYDYFGEWYNLPDREKYRVGGGCEALVRREG